MKTERDRKLIDFLINMVANKGRCPYSDFEVRSLAGSLEKGIKFEGAAKCFHGCTSSQKCCRLHCPLFQEFELTPLED